MNRFRIGAAIAAAALLAACQGSFSNGTSTPGSVMPPAGPSNAPAGPQSVAQASPAAGSGTYPFSQAPSGLQCPATQGFSCVFKFDIPPATPTPAPTATPKASKSKANTKGKKVKPTAKPRPTPKPTASPSPTPAPTASPNGSASPAASGSPAASASPVASATPAGPTVTIKLDALPKNAPAMVNPDPKAVATTPLLAVRMSVDADVTLSGSASADFTLPQEQIGGRGFAIQLFNETEKKHHKLSDQYLGSYSQSTLNGTTLHFEFTPPMVTVKKGEIWLFVLYGDERPSATGSPAPSGSPTASTSAGPSSAPSAPTPTPSPAP